MPAPYKNKTPRARCILKVQDWFANNLSIITQPVRDEMAERIVDEIIDDIVGGAAKDDDPNGHECQTCGWDGVPGASHDMDACYGCHCPNLNNWKEKK